jgi:hypothetical protein
VRQHKVLIVSIAVLVLSQWFGLIWISAQISKKKVTAENVQMQSALEELNANIKRIEELQFTKAVAVNSNANTVTMDQSILQNTLRDIVASELERVSPSLSVEYAQKTKSAAYAGDEAYLEPEQAFMKSKVIIQDAIQYGAWDVKHTAEMAPLVNSLTQEQRKELTEQYMGALSRGEIEPTDVVPPL